MTLPNSMPFDLSPAPIPNRIGRKPPSVGDNVQVLAVGDVHGQASLLVEIIRAFATVATDALPPAEARKMILLGDLIDRGPNSMAVLRALHSVRNEPGIVVLKGNHEAVLLDCIDGVVNPHDGWLEFGGDAFLHSLQMDPPESWPPDPDFGPRLAEAIGEDIVEWLRGLPTSHEEGDYFFCHAGVRPGVPLAEQSDHDLMWIGKAFRRSGKFHGKVVVHGHSIERDIALRHNRVGVDTGAYRSGVLTGLLIQGNATWRLQVSAN